MEWVGLNKRNIIILSPWKCARVGPRRGSDSEQGFVLHHNVAPERKAQSRNVEFFREYFPKIDIFLYVYILILTTLIFQRR